MLNHKALTALGWQPFFQQACTALLASDASIFIPARVVELYRTEITVTTDSETFNLTLLPSMPEMVVGDWLLLNNQKQFLHLLERKTSFSRKSAGSQLKKQFIAANVDTAFIVSSMNEDFNLNRIERFLALVNESGAKPVIILSKKDKAETPEAFVHAIQSLDANLSVEAVNCLDTQSKLVLSPWLTNGTTIAMLGSSGVGKSTLINTLLGENRQATADVRADDKKGRHTTTRRSLIALNTGGLILDTPGIRELQLTDCKTGIAMTFSDIEAYRLQCQFNNCKHQVEPGCAVQEAILSGDLDKRRLDNYLKLREEEVLNASRFSERRSTDKTRHKQHKRTQGKYLKSK